MKKNIIIDNKQYSDVDTVKLQIAGGTEHATFTETSDATASAADIVKGKTAYANGALVTGTHECEGGITPSGTKEITANGTHDVTAFANVLVNVPTGGGSGDSDELVKSILEQSITSLTIPDGTETVGNYAMFNCKNMTSVYFPSSLETIAGSAFAYCGLQSIVFNSGLRIEANAFSNNSNLKSVKFSAGRYSLYTSCFSNCNAIELYDFSEADQVMVLATKTVLTFPSGCVIKIPSALATEWKAADNWKDLTDVVWQDENGNVI